MIDTMYEAPPPTKVEEKVLPALNRAIVEQSKKVSKSLENLNLEKDRIQKLDETLKPLAAAVSLVALMAIYSVVLTIPGGLPVIFAVYCAFYLTVLSGGLLCLVTKSDEGDYSDDRRLKHHVEILKEASQYLQRLKNLKPFFEKNGNSALTEEFFKKQITNIADELEKLKRAIEDAAELQENKNRQLQHFLSQLN